MIGGSRDPDNGVRKGLDGLLKSHKGMLLARCPWPDTFGGKILELWFFHFYWHSIGQNVEQNCSFYVACHVSNKTEGETKISIIN